MTDWPPLPESAATSQEEDEAMGDSATGPSSAPSSQEVLASAELQPNDSPSEESPKVGGLGKAPGSHPDSQGSTPEASLNAARVPQKNLQQQQQQQHLQHQHERQQLQQQQQQEHSHQHAGQVHLQQQHVGQQQMRHLQQQQHLEQHAGQQQLQRYQHQARHPNQSSFPEIHREFSTPVQESMGADASAPHTADDFHSCRNEPANPSDESTALKNCVDPRDDGDRESRAVTATCNQLLRCNTAGFPHKEYDATQGRNDPTFIKPQLDFKAALLCLPKGEFNDKKSILFQSAQQHPQNQPCTTGPVPAARHPPPENLHHQPPSAASAGNPAPASPQRGPTMYSPPPKPGHPKESIIQGSTFAKGATTHPHGRKFAGGGEIQSPEKVFGRKPNPKHLQQSTMHQSAFASSPADTRFVHGHQAQPPAADSGDHRLSRPDQFRKSQGQWSGSGLAGYEPSPSPTNVPVSSGPNQAQQPRMGYAQKVQAQTHTQAPSETSQLLGQRAGSRDPQLRQPGSHNTDYEPISSSYNVPGNPGRIQGQHSGVTYAQMVQTPTHARGQPQTSLLLGRGAGSRNPGLDQQQQFGISQGQHSGSHNTGYEPNSPVSHGLIQAQQSGITYAHVVQTPAPQAQGLPQTGPEAAGPATSTPGDWRGARPKTSHIRQNVSGERTDARVGHCGRKPNSNMSPEDQHRQRQYCGRNIPPGEVLYGIDNIIDPALHHSRPTNSSGSDRSLGQRPSLEGAGAPAQFEDVIRHEHLPSNNPLPDNRTTSWSGLRDESRRRSRDLRTRHDQIRRSCRQSLQDLLQDLTRIHKLDDLLVLCNPVSNEPNERSILGFYQWYTEATERKIQQMKDGCKESNCIGKKVMAELHQKGLKTANLILYFTEQNRRQDIVDFLLEFHPDCECWGIIARQHI